MKNFDVVMPYNALVPLGVLLLTANTNYNGLGTTLDVTPAGGKMFRLHHIHLQSMGTDPATLIRFLLTNAIGGYSPLCRDVPVPAAVASTSVPLFSRNLYFRGLVVPAGTWIKAQTTIGLTAGVNVTAFGQEMET